MSDVPAPDETLDTPFLGMGGGGGALSKDGRGGGGGGAGPEEGAAVVDVFEFV